MTPLSRSRLACFVFCFITLMGYAQMPIYQAVSNFVSDEDLKNAGISISILDIETGALMASCNPNLSLIPASTLKLVTTAPALQLLGKDFVFKTELRYDGHIDSLKHTLYGNIYLKGYGDPTLASSRMEGVPSLETLMLKFAQAVKSKGIDTIRGSIFGDGSYFDYADAIGTSWQWDDIGNAYGAGTWGLNIHDNFYYLDLQRRPYLDTVVTVSKIYPEIPHLSLKSKVIIARSGTGDDMVLLGSPYEGERIVQGEISGHRNVFAMKGAMPDAPLVAAYHFYKALKSLNIFVEKPLTFSLDWQRHIAKENYTKVFYTHNSPNLLEIIKETNTESVNLYAESLLRTLGQKQYQSGSAEAGIKAVKQFWKSKGVDLNGFFMEDGSGLSARNGVSSYHFANILRTIAQDTAFFPLFYNTMARAGESGTLRGLLKNTAAVGRLRAKSGSMNRVRSYIGYTRNANNRTLAFSIIANNYSCSNSEIRKKLERFMLDITLSKD